MALDYKNTDYKPGFNFSNCKRNVHLLKAGFQAPKAITTGTTIAGVIYKNGVVLGADTRATEDSIVADKNCSKIHYLCENIYCCGAGTAADTEMTTDLIASQLRLLNLNTGRGIRVATATNLLKRLLFRYRGYISAALVLGGVDEVGSYIYTVYPTGCSDKLPYASMGSGSLAAMSAFEEGWREDLSEAEAVKLVRNAIAGGIFNDLGSGSNVDICIIRKGEAKYLRNYEIANIKGVRQLNYGYKAGTTAVLKTNIEYFDVVEETIPMEIAD